MRRAREFQRLLGDRDTPPSIAERARIMMAMLTEAELAEASPATGGSTGAESDAGGEDKAKAKAGGQEIEVERADAGERSEHERQRRR